MLSELFSNLEIDETETNKERGQQCTPDNYSAEIHSVGWFLNKTLSIDRKADEDRELVGYRAAYFNYHEDYRNAVDEYTTLFSEYKHSRTHTVAAIDSLVRCALKIPDFPTDKLLFYLDEYEQCALDYGDQLQYLSLKKDVYSKLGLPDASQIFIDTVCLLCASVDLPEHWLAFGQRPSLIVGENFHIGYMTRAALLLERHSKHAHGFVSRVLNKKLVDLRKRLAEVGSLERIEEARQRMGFDIVSHEESTEPSEEMHRPVHDCRSKVEVYKSFEECIIIVERFKNRFNWMFEGCAQE